MTDPAPQTIEWSPAQLARIRRRVWSDTPDGYEVFYSLTFNRPLPPHGREWVEKIYEHRQRGLGTAVEAFRGSTKTTTITEGFVAYRIGLEAQRANMIVRVNDKKAVETGKAVANLIEHNALWKLLFPHVVPDGAQAWGEKGWEVKQTHIPNPATGELGEVLDYGEWRRRRGIDPTLVAYGITSSAIIGAHPDGVLAIDDIHDEENTRSQKELTNVLQILKGTVFPTIIANQTWKLFVGTPWVEGDAVDYIKSTGEFGVVSTPVYREGDASDEGAVFIDKLGSEIINKWVIPTWPEEYTVAVVQMWRRLVGVIEFARMYLLDLSKKAGQGIPFYKFDAERVDANWQYGTGVDYAGTINPTNGLDYFARCDGALHPLGGLVVTGGDWGQYTQAQSERSVLSAQSAFGNWRGAHIEGDGKGEEFFQLMLRQPGLVVTMFKTGNKSLYERVTKQLSPHIENGRIRISTADTPFLNRLRYELEHWPNITNDDCLAALYALAHQFPDALVMPSGEGGRLPMRAPAKRRSPWAGLAGQKV